MPPSAGACQTIEAALKPDCGRAGDRSSIITAIGWRRAAAGDTGSPVSGAGTVTGVGTGVGVGIGVAVGVALGGASVGLALGGAEVVAIAGWLGGVLPQAPATRLTARRVAAPRRDGRIRTGMWDLWERARPGARRRAGYPASTQTADAGITAVSVRRASRLDGE